MDESIATKIIEHYASFDDGGRLDTAFGLLEEARTRELIERHLLRRPCDIVDVGGAAGAYAFWLANDPRARLPVPVAGATLENDQDELVRLAFPDGSKTENDRCIVTRMKLTPELPPVWVNGKPIGFC